MQHLLQLFAKPFVIFLIAFLIYGVINARYHTTGDAITYELLPISIIKDHDLDLDEFLPLFNEMPYAFTQKNGRVISSYPIVPAFLNTPVYFAGSIFGLDLLSNQYVFSKTSSALIASLAVMFMFMILKKKFSLRLALWGTLLYALTTGIWSVVSYSFFGHGTAILFINIALLLILEDKKKITPWSGLFLGFAFFTRPSTIAIILPLALFIIYFKKEYRLKFIALGALPLILLAYYSHTYWGSISALGQYNASGGFQGPLIHGLIGNLISPNRGLFIYMPIALISFVSAFCAWKSKKLTNLEKTLLISAILSILLYSQWSWWWGAVSYGNRFLTEITAILIYFFILAWDQYLNKSLILKIVSIILIVWQFYAHALGAFVYPCPFDETLNQYSYEEQNSSRLWTIRESQILSCSKKLSETIFN